MDFATWHDSVSEPMGRIGSGFGWGVAMEETHFRGHFTVLRGRDGTGLGVEFDPELETLDAWIVFEREGHLVEVPLWSLLGWLEPAADHVFSRATFPTARDFVSVCVASWAASLERHRDEILAGVPGFRPSGT
ncbi:MAG: hypothetical protein WCK58_16530 [Chloroflexota bacterium]